MAIKIACIRVGLIFFPQNAALKAIEHQNLFSNKVIGLLPKTSFRQRIERREK